MKSLLAIALLFFSAAFSQTYDTTLTLPTKGALEDSFYIGPVGAYLHYKVVGTALCPASMRGDFGFTGDTLVTKIQEDWESGGALVEYLYPCNAVYNGLPFPDGGKPYNVLTHANGAKYIWHTTVNGVKRDHSFIVNAVTYDFKAHVSFLFSDRLDGVQKRLVMKAPYHWGLGNWLPNGRRRGEVFN